jgi:hypothetical protein
VNCHSNARDLRIHSAHTNRSRRVCVAWLKSMHSSAFDRFSAGISHSHLTHKHHHPHLITPTPPSTGRPRPTMASDEGSDSGGDGPMPKLDLYGYGSNVDLRCVLVWWLAAAFEPLWAAAYMCIPTSSSMPALPPAHPTPPPIPFSPTTGRWRRCTAWRARRSRTTWTTTSRAAGRWRRCSSTRAPPT